MAQFVSLPASEMPHIHWVPGSIPVAVPLAMGWASKFSGSLFMWSVAHHNKGTFFPDQEHREEYGIKWCCIKLYCRVVNCRGVNCRGVNCRGVNCRPPNGLYMCLNAIICDYMRLYAIICYYILLFAIICWGWNCNSWVWPMRLYTTYYMRLYASICYYMR